MKNAAVGQVVQVAGIPSPLMRVKGIARDDDEKRVIVFCVWFDVNSSKLYREPFAEELLELVKTADQVTPLEDGI